jgi:hypothetical protein
VTQKLLVVLGKLADVVSGLTSKVEKLVHVVSQANLR